MAVFGTSDMKAAIAAGCSFGPTSLGIALNILRGGGVLNTPVGQLIISAAVIDDMIALIVLSQLESLTGTITAAGVLIPVISALGFLIIGDVTVLPRDDVLCYGDRTSVSGGGGGTESDQEHQQRKIMGFHYR